MKSLLSVRSPGNNLCPIEANMPSLAALIKHKRTSYLQKKILGLKIIELYVLS